MALCSLSRAGGLFQSSGLASMHRDRMNGERTCLDVLRSTGVRPHAPRTCSRWRRRAGRSNGRHGVAATHVLARPLAGRPAEPMGSRHGSSRRGRDGAIGAGFSGSIGGFMVRAAGSRFGGFGTDCEGAMTSCSRPAGRTEGVARNLIRSCVRLKESPRT